MLESTPAGTAVAERRNGDATLHSELSEEEEDGAEATPITPALAATDSTGKKVGYYTEN